MKKIVQFFMLLVLAGALSACGDGPCSISFSFKYCLDQKSSSSSSSQSSAAQTYTVGGTVSGLQTGQEINLVLNRPAALFEAHTDSPISFPGSGAVGWSFTLASAKTVTSLGLYNTDFNADTTVAIWDSSGALVTSTVFPLTLTGIDQSDSSGFLWKAVTSQTLSAGQYTVSAFSSDNHFGAFGTTSSFTSGLSSIGFSLYNSAAVSSKPTDSLSDLYSNGLFGPNLRFEAAIEKAVTTNGSFTIDTTLLDGELYTVSVSAKTGNPSCSITGATGKVNAANITQIQVQCN